MEGTHNFIGNDIFAHNTYMTGNVGIGSAAPLTKLDVSGTITATAFSGDGSGLSGTGDNLGNHTATHKYLPNSPQTTENMETREVLTPQTREMESVKIEDIPIIDVRPGDHVLSLNEEKGKIEPHRILVLLDMGVKPVFKLTTKDGKSITTTGNHPYLTKDGGWKKVIDLAGDEKIAVLAHSGNYLTRKSFSSSTYSLENSLGASLFNNLRNAEMTLSGEGGWILIRIIPHYFSGGYINIFEKWMSWVSNTVPQNLPKYSRGKPGVRFLLQRPMTRRPLDIKDVKGSAARGISTGVSSRRTCGSYTLKISRRVFV